MRKRKKRERDGEGKERKNGREKWEGKMGEKKGETDVLRKDYDTERRLFEGNGYRDLFDVRTVEISIDSQLGWIPSVVSAPIPHPR